jgi:hypothetical protein
VNDVKQKLGAPYEKPDPYTPLQKPVVVKHAQRDFATRNLDPKARLLANGVLDLTEFGVKAMVPVVGLPWASASAASETANRALVQGDTNEGAMKKAVAAGLGTYVTGKAAEGLLKNAGGFIKDAKGGKIGAAGEAAPKENIVDQPFDNAGNLKPDVKYKSGEFDYGYETDPIGRVEKVAVGDLQQTTRSERLRHNPNTPGKLLGDHAGHLVGDRFGGSPNLENLITQSSKVNLSQYKIIENRWAKALAEGKKVSYDIEIKYHNNSDKRPSSFNIVYYIDGQNFQIN